MHHQRNQKKTKYQSTINNYKYFKNYINNRNKEEMKLNLKKDLNKEKSNIKKDYDVISDNCSMESLAELEK